MDQVWECIPWPGQVIWEDAGPCLCRIVLIVSAAICEDPGYWKISSHLQSEP